MDETASADPGAGPAVVVELTPRSYRSRSILFVVVGVLLVGLSVWLGDRDDRFVNPFVGLTAIGYGLYCARQARRQVTRTLLRIDRSGIRSGDGVYDQGWGGVVMVWVGSSTGLRVPLVTEPVLSVFTGSGLDFARRAGTRPKALCSVPVGAPWTVRKLCEQLAAITDVPVVDGRTTSRAAAAATLQYPGRD